MNEVKNDSPPGSSGRDFTHGPVLVTLLLFAMPTLGSSILQSLNGSINAIWIGQYLGEAALSATVNANLVMFLMLGSVFGFGMAATIFIGQAIGKGDINAARRVVGAAAFWFLCISLVVAFSGWFFTPNLLRLLDTPVPAMRLATSYLRVIFIALPVMFFLNFLMMALRGVGDAKTPLIFMGLAVVIDIALTPLLMLGIGPLPRLGIAGAATATLIAQAIGLLGMLGYIYHNDLTIRLRGDELRYIFPAKYLSKSILVKGLPMGMQIMVVSGSAVVMISYVNGYGINTTAAFGVTAQLWNYIQMPAMALGAAASAMAAQNIGAGRWHRVSAITRAGVIANIALTGLLVLAIHIADKFVLTWFLDEASAAVGIAENINAIVNWSFIFFGVMMVLFGTVRATGSVIAPLIITVVSMIGVRIGFVIMFEPVMGAEAIWWSYPVSSAVSMILAIAYYKFGNWRSAKIIGKQSDECTAQDASLACENTSISGKPNWVSVN